MVGAAPWRLGLGAGERTCGRTVMSRLLLILLALGLLAMPTTGLAKMGYPECRAKVMHGSKSRICGFRCAAAIRRCMKAAEPRPERSGSNNAPAALRATTRLRSNEMTAVADAVAVAADRGMC
jgi:hypothetical protein